MKSLLVILFLTSFTFAQEEKVVDLKHPAFQAISNNQIDVLKGFLEEEKLSPNLKNKFDKTLLHYASILNNLSAVKLLIQHKADVNKLDKQNLTPLIYSVRKSFKEKEEKQKQFNIIKILVENKADISRKDQLKEDVLIMAAYNGNFRVMKFLMDQNSVSLKNQNIYKQTALHSAVLGAMASKKEKSQLIENYQLIVKLLLKKGADINAVDLETRTPLHYMAEHGFSEMLKEALKQKNILIDLQTKEGWSALHLAAGNRSVENIRLLISHGANVNLKDKTEFSPIYLAVGSGSKEAVTLLLRAKADVFFQDKKGNDIFDSQTSEKLKNLLNKLRV